MTTTLAFDARIPLMTASTQCIRRTLARAAGGKRAARRVTPGDVSAVTKRRAERTRQHAVTSFAAQYDANEAARAAEARDAPADERFYMEMLRNAA